MDGNLLSRYEFKIEEFENKIKNESDENKKKIIISEQNDYMSRTVPFLIKYHEQSVSTDKHSLDSLFSSSSKELDKKGIQKQDIFHEYLKEVEDYKGSFGLQQRPKVVRPQYIDMCKECNQELILDAEKSDLICTNCGRTYVHMGEELTYKEEQEHEIIFNYSYKRENHFNEWIVQLQAQESVNIPPDLIEKLRSEFKKQKVISLDDITHSKIRTALKKLKYHKYYEHIPYIITLLTGKKPLNITNELEEKLRQMFKLIQEPFDRNCPSSRKNFLSYSYVLYKFFELLEEDDFLPYFTLLKSKEKLYQQDVIWKKICKDLQWEFIHTI
jgi:hypothetical protein